MTTAVPDKASRTTEDDSRLAPTVPSDPASAAATLQQAADTDNACHASDTHAALVDMNSWHGRMIEDKVHGLWAALGMRDTVGGKPVPKIRQRVEAAEKNGGTIPMQIKSSLADIMTIAGTSPTSFATGSPLASVRRAFQAIGDAATGTTRDHRSIRRNAARADDIARTGEKKIRKLTASWQTMMAPRTVLGEAELRQSAVYTETRAVEAAAAAARTACARAATPSALAGAIGAYRLIGSSGAFSPRKLASMEQVERQKQQAFDEDRLKKERSVRLAHRQNTLMLGAAAALGVTLAARQAAGAAMTRATMAGGNKDILRRTLAVQRITNPAATPARNSGMQYLDAGEQLLDTFEQLAREAEDSAMADFDAVMGRLERTFGIGPSPADRQAADDLFNDLLRAARQREGDDVSSRLSLCPSVGSTLSGSTLSDYWS
jgi:hypothetical protein